MDNTNPNYWVTRNPLLPALSRIFTYPVGIIITVVEIDLFEKIEELYLTKNIG